MESRTGDSGPLHRPSRFTEGTPLGKCGTDDNRKIAWCIDGQQSFTTSACYRRSINTFPLTTQRVRLPSDTSVLRYVLVAEWTVFKAARLFRVFIPSGIARSGKARCNTRHEHQIARSPLWLSDIRRKTSRRGCERAKQAMREADPRRRRMEGYGRPAQTFPRSRNA
jgi:hypothetical protein